MDTEQKEEKGEAIHNLQAIAPELEKLSGFVGIVPGVRHFAVPPFYKKKYPGQPERWPVFKLKPQDGLEFNAEVDDGDLYYWDPNAKRYLIKSGEFRIARLRASVEDWKNLADAAGNHIPFPRGEDGRLTREGIRHLPGPLQMWLMSEIDRASTATPEESDGLKF